MKRYLCILVIFSFTATIVAHESLQGPTGLLLHEEDRAFNGYTLFAAHGTSYLIDMKGNLVHQWKCGVNPRLLDNGNLLDAMQDNPSSFAGFQELDWDGNVVWSYREERPDYAPHHDFVRVFNKKLNAWTTLYIAGKTITREQALDVGCDPAMAPSDAPDSKGGGRLAKGGKTMVDAVVEVDMAGNVVWEWWFFDHLVQDRDSAKPNYVEEIASMPGRLNMHLPGKPLRGDWLHCNSLDYDSGLDQIVINSVQGEFYVIDHGGTFDASDPQKSIELAAGHKGDFLYRCGDPARYEQGDPPRILENWTKATAGHKQIGGAHDVHWVKPGLPGAGHLMVFNNGQYLFEATPQSSVLEINPFINESGDDVGHYVNSPEAGYLIQRYPPDTHKSPRQISRQIVWQYSSKSNQGFFSHIGSGAQRLPNGNTLICSDTEGHLFEVTAEGELVWEFINPITKDFGVLKVMPDVFPMANSVFRAYRYSADHVALKGHDLSAKGLLSDVVRRPVRMKPEEVALPSPEGDLNQPGNFASRPQSEPAQNRNGRFPTGMDSNNDGQVVFSEFLAHEKSRKPETDENQARGKFDRIDKNGDGQITASELEAAPRGKPGGEGGGNGES